MALSWLKILLNGKTDNTDATKKKSDEKVVEEKQPEIINLTNLNNKANTAVIAQNNGNIPLIQNLSNPEDDMMGLGIQRTTSAEQEQTAPTTPVEEQPQSIEEKPIEEQSVAEQPVTEQTPVVEQPPTEVKEEPVVAQAPVTVNAGGDAQSVSVSDKVDGKDDDLMNKAADDPIWAENKKKGPGLDDALTRFYGKNYTNASEEDKEKLIVRYFDWLSDTKKGQISQGRQFDIYRERCTSPEEYARLCSVIDKMEAQYQAGAADSAMNKGTDSQKAIGRKSVYEDMDNYDEGASINIKQQLIKAVDKEPDVEKKIKLIDEYISYAPKSERMADVGVRTARSVENNKDIDEKVRKEYGIKASENIKYTSEDVQLEHVQSGYDSEFQEVRLATAGQAHLLAEQNQTSAVEMGLELNDEEIANVFASNAYEFDINNRDSILAALQNCGYDSVMETLNKAQADYEKQQKLNEKAAAEQRRKNELAKQSNNQETKASEQVISSKEEKVSIARQDSKAFEKVKEVKNLSGKELEDAIKDLAENSTPAQLKSLALGGLKDELIKFYLANPTIENMNKLSSLRNELSFGDKKEFDEQIEKSNNQVLDNFFIFKDNKIKK